MIQTIKKYIFILYKVNLSKYKTQGKHCLKLPGHPHSFQMQFKLDFQNSNFTGHSQAGLLPELLNQELSRTELQASL